MEPNRDILIVDDDRQVRDVLHQIFLTAGYNWQINSAVLGVEDPWKRRAVLSAIAAVASWTLRGRRPPRNEAGSMRPSATRQSVAVGSLPPRP